MKFKYELTQSDDFEDTLLKNVWRQKITIPTQIHDGIPINAKQKPRDKTPQSVKEPLKRL